MNVTVDNITVEYPKSINTKQYIVRKKYKPFKISSCVFGILKK